MEAILLCIIGDRLDLFKKLEKYGPITSQDFAQKSNTSERYAKEWLNGLTCAQCIEYNPIDNTFRFPDEHAHALTKEGGPGLIKKLKEGIKVADIGCVRGKAIVKLTKTFPNTKFYGYDIHKELIEGAILNAKMRN